MEIEITFQEPVTIVALKGTLDNDSAQGAIDQMNPLFRKDARILVDLGGLTYISSAGLRVLLLINRQVVLKSARVAFVGMSFEVKDVMEITGFLKFLPTAESHDAAIEFLKG